VKYDLSYQREDALYKIKNLPDNYVVAIEKKTKQRTGQQNKALHLYCELLAETMNDAGYDQRLVMPKMKEGFLVPWTQESVKRVMWHSIQKTMFDEESTKKLTTEQVSDVYRVIDKWTSENLNISLPFPER